MDDFDPFASNYENPNAMSDMQCLNHLLNAAVGTGVLSMPFAFMDVGLILGILGTAFAGLICTHCAYVLVQSAHRIYYAERRSKMTYAEVTETAFARGPEWAKKLAVTMKMIVLISLFLTYFGSCSLYTVIIAKNMKQVITYWTGQTYGDRFLISVLVIPITILAFIPNLKQLAPFSIVANILVATVLAISCYYMFRDMPKNLSERKMFNFYLLPSFFAMTIYAIEAIGVIMPLENNMRTPQHFLGLCGVLNKGMFVVSTFCAFLGFLGYFSYGERTEEAITLNLPVDEWLAQFVTLLLTLSVFLTIGIQFSVVLETTWNVVKTRFMSGSTFGNYVVRSFLSFFIIMIAVAVPTIAPFIALIGAFCFSVLGLILPILIESIVGLEMDIGFGRFNWVLWKNVFIFFFGILALILGSERAISDILELYQ